MAFTGLPRRERGQARAAGTFLSALYLLRAEGRIADRHEAYFADGFAAIAAANHVIGVLTLSREQWR
jgi:hypothetical protein